MIASSFAADLPSLELTPQDALETYGLSVFLFHNAYHGVFGDEKMSGIEIILQDQRIATNGATSASRPLPRSGTRSLNSWTASADHPPTS
jgi:hypothetical protein